VARVTIAVDETGIGAAGAIGIETGAGVAVVTDAVLEAAAEGIETTDDVVESSQMRDRSVPRISIKNRRQKDKNLPCDSTG